MEQKRFHLPSVFVNHGKKNMPGALVAVIALGMLCLALASRQSVLIVKTLNPDRTVLCARMTEGEEWAVSYTHSVNKRPVYDYLQIRGTQLLIARSRYDAFGAGMPETTTPENPLRVGKNGWLEYTVNRLVPDVRIFVGRVAGHRLHLKGREIPFASLANPGKTLCFSSEKMSLWRILAEGCLWKQATI